MEPPPPPPPSNNSASADASASNPLVPVPMENTLPQSLSPEVLLYYQDWNQEMDMGDTNAPQVQEDDDAPQLLEDAQFLEYVLEALQEDPSVLEGIDFELEDILSREGIFEVEGHPLWEIWRPFVEAQHALRAAVPAVVERLPTITVDATFLKENKLTKDTVCAVCRQGFDEGHLVKKLGCSHCYHVPCILSWLEIRNTCPICRHPLPRENQP